VATADPPAVTDAVKLTTTPELTVVTVLPPDVTARLVVLTAGVCARSAVGAQEIENTIARRKTEKLLGKFAAGPEKRGRGMDEELRSGKPDSAGNLTGS